MTARRRVRGLFHGRTRSTFLIYRLVLSDPFRGPVRLVWQATGEGYRKPTAFAPPAPDRVG